MKGWLHHQFLRFVLVGCVNTGFSYGLYAFFLWLGLNFALANLLAFSISILFSFSTQSRLVFGNHDWRLLLRFVLVWCAIYLFNIGLIALLMRMQMSAYLAGALALVPVTLLSYLLQKLVVFGPSRSRADETQVRHTT